MKALTLKHPWPWAICVLGKRIENRSWKPSPAQLKVGEWFAIHGGKWPTSANDLDDVKCEAVGLARDFVMCLPPGDLTVADVRLHSGIVAVCRFGGIVTSAREASRPLPGAHEQSPWFEGPFGWVLRDLVVLRDPVPCKGARGLWDIPEDVLAQVREQWKAVKAGEVSR